MMYKSIKINTTMNQLNYNVFNKTLSELNRFEIMKDYFKVNGLVKHQIGTYNWFITKGLKNIINKVEL